MNGSTTEPQANRWYNLKLGSSFNNHKLNSNSNSNSNTKFCTLRYEFKPASIDKTQPGSLHKSKENRVTVEFHNIQPGKPKLTFEGSSEEYKDMDGVLFFDGDTETFQLEKLNRAFKSLKHMRVPGENLTGTNGGSNTECHSPPLNKVARTQNVNRPSMHAIPLEVERIDIGEPENIVTRPMSNNKSTNPDPFSPSPSPQHNNNQYSSQIDILGDNSPGTHIKTTPQNRSTPAVGFDINVPNHQDFDDEIEIAFDDDDVDNHEGMSAAEALMRGEGNGDLQLGDKERELETSSSGGSSSSSESSSGSSSSESDAGDSASSGGEIDVI